MASSLKVSAAELGTIKATVREDIAEFIDITVINKSPEMAQKVVKKIPSAFNEELIRLMGIDCVQVVYEASEPLKKRYSIDSTMEELLNHPDIRAFLSQMVEVDMIPDIAYGLSLRDVAKTFAGEIKPEEAQMLDIALANF